MIRRPSIRTRAHARAVVAAVAGCLFAAMGAAGAAPSSDSPPTARVSYADLDLTTEQGVHTLYRRIVAAAEHVCPSAPMQELSRYAKVRECRKHAVAEAVARIGNARLAALLPRYDGHS